MMQGIPQMRGVVTRLPSRVRPYFKTIQTGLEWRFLQMSGRSNQEVGAWLCQRLEEDGPTFIKIGQLISSRADVFGKDLASELVTLQDRTTGMDFAEIRALLEARGLTDQLQSVDPVPIASASIAQVHTAQLKDGTQVVLKVKRPGVDARIQEDMRAIHDIVDVMCRLGVPGIRETREVFQGFERTLRGELDYKREAECIRRFGSIYEGSLDVAVPKVYSELCNEDVIVMEYMPSVRLTEAPEGVDRKAMAERLISLFIQQLIYEGVLHGDPHAGNVGLVGGRFVLYDLGNIIDIPTSYRDRMRDLLYYLQLKDVDGILSTLQEVGIKVMNPRFMKKYLRQYLVYLDTLDVKDLSISNLDLSTLGSRVPIQLDPITLRIFRSVTILEGLCKQLDPDFSYKNVLSSNIESMMLDNDYIVYRINRDLGTLMGRSQPSALESVDGVDAPQDGPMPLSHALLLVNLLVLVKVLCS